MSSAWRMLVSLVGFLAVASAAEAAGSCISQGARFPKFAFEGKPPRKSSRGPEDLQLCRIYRGRTCCTAAQTQQAMMNLKKLAVNGEAGNECLALWEVLECSVCDPRVGISPGPPLLCPEFCESLYGACSTAFFSMDHSKQAIMPCGSTDIICAQGSEWTGNSTLFCELAGFRVSSLTESAFCFDGTVGAETEFETDKVEPDSKRPSKTHKKHEKYSKLTSKKLYNRLWRLLMTDNVLWAIGGLVLTVGAVLYRQRGDRAKQRRMAMMKTIQGVRARQQAALSSTSANRMAKKA